MYDDNLPRRERAQILSEQQGHRCCYCGVRFADEMPADIRLYCDPRPSVEHVRRIADGGERCWWNEVAACRGCNSARGEIDPETFYRLASTRSIDEMRRVLRTSMSAKRRARATRRQNGAVYQSVKRVGPKWPPVIGELPMTPGRQEYFALINAIHREPITTVPLPERPLPEGAPVHKRSKKKANKLKNAIVEINGIRALRWDVRSI